MISLLKKILPNRPIPLTVLRGPFRGAKIVVNPRCSLRKIFGVYEYELNPWLEAVLKRIDCVIDVGANDGYFMFGCASAFRRLGKGGEIIAIDPHVEIINQLNQSVRKQPKSDVTFQIINAFAGKSIGPNVVTLNSLKARSQINTLIKIDVEGAELEVLKGADSWISKSNYFVIEVHQRSLLDELIAFLKERDCEVVRIDQRPLPIIGREHRDLNNWWLVTRLGESVH